MVNLASFGVAIDIRIVIRRYRDGDDKYVKWEFLSAPIESCVDLDERTVILMRDVMDRRNGDEFGMYCHIGRDMRDGWKGYKDEAHERQIRKMVEALSWKLARMQALSQRSAYMFRIYGHEPRPVSAFYASGSKEARRISRKELLRIVACHWPEAVRDAADRYDAYVRHEKLYKKRVEMILSSDGDYSMVPAKLLEEFIMEEERACSIVANNGTTDPKRFLTVRVYWDALGEWYQNHPEKRGAFICMDPPWGTREVVFSVNEFRKAAEYGRKHGRGMDVTDGAYDRALSGTDHKCAFCGRNIKKPQDGGVWQPFCFDSECTGHGGPAVWRLDDDRTCDEAVLMCHTCHDGWKQALQAYRGHSTACYGDELPGAISGVKSICEIVDPAKRAEAAGHFVGAGYADEAAGICVSDMEYGKAFHGDYEIKRRASARHVRKRVRACLYKLRKLNVRYAQKVDIDVPKYVFLSGPACKAFQHGDYRAFAVYAADHLDEIAAYAARILKNRESAKEYKDRYNAILRRYGFSDKPMRSEPWYSCDCSSVLSGMRLAMPVSMYYAWPDHSLSAGRQVRRPDYVCSIDTMCVAAGLGSILGEPEPPRNGIRNRVLDAVRGY